MGTQKEQGKYVSVYITSDLIEAWREIEEKSKFVQEAIRETQDVGIKQG